MGFRFTFESANAVANLTCGKADACYDSIYATPDNQGAFLDFLTHLSKSTHTKEDAHCHHALCRALDTLQENTYGNQGARHPRQTESFLVPDSRNYEVMDALCELSDAFDRYRVRAFLLPQIACGDRGLHDGFMLDEQTVARILKQYPQNSCLILQPQDRPQLPYLTVFDAFPYFEIALRQAELWPAVLFWNHETQQSAFVPISTDENLNDLFQIAYHQPDWVVQLGKRLPCVPSTRNGGATSHHPTDDRIGHYYLHLSDLHFGAKPVEITQRRLQSLVTTRQSLLDTDDRLKVIITGDAVDSPSKKSEAAYRSFVQFLKTQTGADPLFVLGNHDINTLGLSFFRKIFHNRYSLERTTNMYPQIKIDDDIGAAFLLFNSNTNGVLAQGEIGRQQISDMGDLLDRHADDLRNHMLIAVLHHHIALSGHYGPPAYYGDERWYDTIALDDSLDDSLRLRDADAFWKFLIERDVRFVLHGHKHTPLIVEQNGIHIIACGSSTGRAKEHISHNLLRFGAHALTCTQFVESRPESGSSTCDIMSVVIDY